MLKQLRAVEVGTQRVLEVVFPGPLEGTILQSSTDKRSLAKVNIQHALYQSKQQRMDSDLQAAIIASGVNVKHMSTHVWGHHVT